MKEFNKNDLFTFIIKSDLDFDEINSYKFTIINLNADYSYTFCGKFERLSLFWTNNKLISEFDGYFNHDDEYVICINEF